MRRKAAYKIDDLEGICPGHREALGRVGIVTTDHLLQQCRDAAGRKATAERTGLAETQLLKWAHMADLMRVPGIGEEYSELLEATGVDTVGELKDRNPESLVALMRQVNDREKLVRVLPSAATVAKWVGHAQDLSPVVTS